MVDYFATNAPVFKSSERLQKVFGIAIVNFDLRFIDY